MAGSVYMSLNLKANSSEFQKAMHDAVSVMNRASHEAGMARAQFELYGKESKGVQAVISTLNTKLEQQEKIVDLNRAEHNRLSTLLSEQKIKYSELGKKVDEARTAYEKNKDATGENSTESKKLKAELSDLESEYKKTGREVVYTTNALDKQERELMKSEDSAMDLRLEIKKTEEEFKKLGYSVEDAQSAQKDMGNETKRSHASLKDLGGLMKDNVSKSASDMKDGIVNAGQAVATSAKDMGTKIKDFATDTIHGENTVKAFGDALREKLEKRLSGAGDEMSETAKDSGELADELEDTGKSAEDSGKHFKKLDGVLKGMGASMGAAAVAAGAATLKLGKEVVQQFGGLEQGLDASKVVFKDYAADIQTSGENAYKNLGVSQSKYLSTANKMGSLLKGAGFSQKEVLAQTERAMQRAADVAATMGISTEDALYSVTGALKGNYTMMDNLGVAMNATTVEAYAAAKGIDFVFKEATQAEKASIALEMFMDKTSDSAGKFSKEAETTITGSLGTLQAAIGSFTAGLGNSDADMKSLTLNIINSFQSVVKNIAPVIENIASALPAVISTVLPEIESLLPSLLETVTGLFSQVLKMLLTLIPTLIPAAVDAIMTIVKALVDNLPLLISAAVQLVTALVSGIGSALPKLIPAAIDAIMAIVDGLLENLDPLLTAALDLILALADGLLTALPKLIEKLPDIINGIIKFVVSAIPQIIDAGIKLLTSLIGALPDIIQAIVKALPEIIDGIVSGVLGAIPDLVKAGVDLFVALVQNLPQITIEIVKAVPDIIKSLLNSFKEAIPQMLSAGGDILRGLWDGIAGAVPEMLKNIGELGGSIIDGFKSIFKINSPSKVFAEIGGNLSVGLSKGINDKSKSVTTALQGVANKATQEAKKTYKSMAEEAAKEAKQFNTLAKDSAKQAAYYENLAKNSRMKTKDAYQEKAKEARKAAKEYEASSKEAQKAAKEYEKTFNQASVAIQKDVAQANKIVQQSFNTFSKELTKINTTHNSNLSALLKEHKKNQQAIRDEYAKTVEGIKSEQQKMAEGIAGFAGLFDAPKDKTEELLNPATILENARLQTQQVESFYKTMELLRKRNIPQEIIDQFADMGPDSAQQLALFAKMTDKELQEYIKLYTKRNKIADSLAAKQFADERAAAKLERDKALTAAEKDYEKAVAKEEKRYNAELAKFQKNAEKQMLEIGKAIKEGLKKGTTMTKSETAKITDNLTKDLIAKVKKELGIKSPSTVFAGIGGYMADGLRLGFVDAMEGAEKDMRRAVPTNFDITSNIQAFDQKWAGRESSPTNAQTMNGTNHQIFNFTTPKPLSEREAARQMKRVSRELALGIA